jgi:hypothetical protein
MERRRRRLSARSSWPVRPSPSACSGESAPSRQAAAGRIDSKFRIEARGFLAAAPDKEDVKVTLTGTFVALGNSTVATVQQVTPLFPL